MTQRNEQLQDVVPGEYVLGWLEHLDMRLAVAKELRGRFVQLTEDLGGVDSLSYQQRSLCERGVWLEYWLARQERVLAEDGEFNVGQWVQASNALLGLYRHLGIARRAKPAESLEQFKQRIAARTQQEAQVPAD